MLESSSSISVRRATFMIVLLCVTVAFFGLVKDFIMACFWAAILAIVFNGIHVWSLKRWHNRNLSAAFTTFFILVAVITPIFLVTLAIVSESRSVIEQIQSGELHPREVLADIQRSIPDFEGILARNGIPSEDISERLSTFARNGIESLGNAAVTTTQSAINFVIQFSLMLYLLYFFIRDGREIVNAIKRALPIGDEIEELIFQRFAHVSRATLKGTMVVAIVQGTIGGIAFAALGIPGATLWGVIMILLSLLPVGGSMFVWVPAAIILFLDGQVGKAIILVIIGALFIGLIDNLLRPRLVSRDTKMPDYLVLLATLGGLTLFGLSGFIIGPVIAALFITCWQITGQLFGKDNSPLSEAYDGS